MAYLTPDPADYDEVCRTLVIPAGYAAVVMGALDELTQIFNWEANGSETPDDAVAAMLDMIAAAYESECYLPQIFDDSVMFIWAEGRNVVGNGLSHNRDPDQVLNMFWNQASPSVNDYMQFSRVLRGGSYSLTMMGIQGSDSGILTWDIDGAEDAETMDRYSATTLWNQGSTISVYLDGDGLHLIGCKVKSKNASSSGYRNMVSWLRLRRIGA